MSLSEERLAEMRERATCPSAVQAVQIGEYEACARTLVERDVPALLDEVERLRAGIAERDREVAARAVQEADDMTLVAELVKRGFLKVKLDLDRAGGE